MKRANYAKPATHQSPRVQSLGVCQVCRETRYKDAEGLILPHQTARRGGRVVAVHDCQGAGQRAQRAIGETVTKWDE